MSLKNVLLACKKMLLAWSRGPTQPVRRCGLLRGELLEGRCVPTLYAWDPVTGNGFSTPGNWLKEAGGGWGTTLDVPGVNDTAAFYGQVTNGLITEITNVPCTIGSAASVNKVVIADGYTSPITLNAGLTVSGTASSGSSLLFYSNATIQGGGGSLTIAGATNFIWRTGTLQGLTTIVGQGARMTVPTPTEGAAARTMTGATLEVRGTLDWSGGNVAVAGPSRSEVHVQAGGAFNISAAGGTWGGTDRTWFAVVNRGAVSLNVPGAGAALKGDYTSYGATTLTAGTLSLGGLAEQGAGGTFQLNPGTIVYLTPPSAGGVGVLGIRDGTLTGTGSVQGSLVLGNAAPNLVTNPVIAPGRQPGDIGLILVTGDFQIFAGTANIDVAGPDPSQYDQLVVSGYAALTGSVVGHLTPGHQPIPAGTPINFLHADGNLVNDFVTVTLPDGTVARESDGWKYLTSDVDAWFEPKVDIGGANGKISGMTWDDNPGLARGVFEPAAEAGLEGIPVGLLDGTGTTIIANTQTAPDGSFSFDNVPAGTYIVEFGGYLAWRLAPQYATTDPTRDSDPDPTNGQALVYVTGDMDDIDAGYYTNAFSIAVDDGVATAWDTPIDIDLFANDSDPDGDTLTLMSWTWPEYGSVSFNGGVATYTPPYGWTGTDTFSYTASDGHGGYDTALVSVEVGPPASNNPPVANDDSAECPYDGSVDIQVLANDSDPDSDPLVIESYTQPAYGSVVLSPDGTYLTYYPVGDGSHGSDSFTYTVTDGRGGYDTATVTITIIGGDGDSGTIDWIVWYDGNENGIQDDGTAGLAGVPVYLFDGSGNQVGSTVSGPDGRYSFSDLAGGTYYVGFGVPAGYALAPKDQGTDDTADSDPDPVYGMTDTFTLPPDEAIHFVDAGLYSA